MWRCVLTAAGANPRRVPGCQKGDEHCSICGGAAGEAPGDVGGKRRLARQFCFGQDWLPCSSGVGSFLVSWNPLLLHKGSFCFSHVACPKWDSLLLPSRWLFCLLSNLFIQMGLKFVLGAHYPEDKTSPTVKWEHSYWMLKMMDSVSRICLKVHAYLKIPYKEMHPRWSLHLLVSSLTDESKFAHIFTTLPFKIFSFDPTCSRGRWYRSPVHTLQPGWESLLPSGGGCSSMASCSPPSWGPKKCHPCPEGSFLLAQRGDLHKGSAAVGFWGWLFFHVWCEPERELSSCNHFLSYFRNS